MSHRARKRFGQHFLHDPQVIARIVAAVAPASTDLVVEIGPGQAAITDPLLSRVDVLHVVELDRDLAAALARRPDADTRLIIHQADALDFDFGALATKNRKLRVIGNLPYNVSSPLLFHLMTQTDSIADMHFMLQKEVVDRICADPGSKTYGRLSVTLGSFCAAKKLFDIGKGAFNPPPKVESAFVRLIPDVARVNAVHDRDVFDRVVRAAFSQRRKTIRNALKNLVQDEQFAAAGVDATLRPERLSVGEYTMLANVVAEGR